MSYLQIFNVEFVDTGGLGMCRIWQYEVVSTEFKLFSVYSLKLTEVVKFSYGI